MTREPREDEIDLTEPGHAAQSLGPPLWVTGVRFPHFGTDAARVAGYTEPGHEVFARVFSPLLFSAGTYAKWSAASASVGVELVGTTRWEEVCLAGRARGVDVGRPQQGTVDERTVEALISVLGARTQRARGTYFALWQGYAGEIDPQLYRESVLIPPSGDNYLFDGSFRLFHADLAWARTRCYEKRRRFPVAVWPADRSFVLATALYQDSYYLSADRRTLALLQEAGLDALEISREELLPSTGD